MAKILVVDDHQLCIRLLLDALPNLNEYKVILAESGRKGLELYRRECSRAWSTGVGWGRGLGRSSHEGE